MNPYESLTVQQLIAISKQLKEDEAKMNHYLKLFKDWLKCQPHLPQEIDEHLISNFIRLSKMDLKRAKMKFESYVIATVKYPLIFQTEEITESLFLGQDVHKMATFLPKLSEDGRRVVICREANPTSKQFDFLNVIKYCMLLANHLLIDDTNAGLECIIDFDNVSLQHMKCVDVKLLADTLQVITQVFPFRLSGCYVMNLPTYLQTLFLWALALVPEKIRKRAIVLKNPEDILKYYPKEMLPEDYYGTEKSTQVLGEMWRTYLLEDKIWFQKFKKVKLMGQIPKAKQVNGETELEGSFRTLCID